MPDYDSLAAMSLAEAAAKLRSREVRSVDLTRACLDRIQRLDRDINAFITVITDLAMEEAAVADYEVRNGVWRGPLHGIPIALKDLIDVACVRTTAASALLVDSVALSEADITIRLRKAGAVILGKTNLHEFAYGGSGVISHFGPVKNPVDKRHITGGSSSGSAAAVAAGLCFGAIGTDTAGSIRLPATYCGIVGLKPSYGLVSTRGIIPLSWTLDHVGPMARTVSDAALILQAIAHYDMHDIYCRKFPPVYYPSALAEPVSNLRLATPRAFWQEGDAEVVKAVDAGIKLLAGMTAGVHEISISIHCDRTVVRCEPWVYHQKYLPAHEKDYDPESLRRIRSGSDVSAASYVEKYRELLHQRREILHIFEEADLLLTPTSPVLPPSFAELEQQPAELRSRELVMLRNTRPWNVYGLPAISVPCGFSASGLPIGLQIIGAPGSEGVVMALAHAFESQTEWHKRRPRFED